MLLYVILSFVFYLRRFVFLLMVLAMTQAVEASSIRVLFLGHDRKQLHNSSAYAPLLIGRLGWDAIYSDSFTGPSCLNARMFMHYDAVMLYGDHDMMTPAQLEALNS